MNLYEEYIKERENLTTIKTTKGFICYRIDFPVCVINDYFVSKEYRNSGHGYFLADQVFQICKEAGVKAVHCFSDERTNGHDLSKYTIENFGFELIREDGFINEYKMEVSEWARY